MPALLPDVTAHRFAAIFDGMPGRTKSSVTACSLLLLLCIPAFLPALHELFHYHQHFQCTATKSEVHLHASWYECDLCDFLTKPHLYLDPVWGSQTRDTLLSNQQIQISRVSYFQPILGTHYLRGPPALIV